MNWNLQEKNKILFLNSLWSQFSEKKDNLISIILTQIIMKEQRSNLWHVQQHRLVYYCWLSLLSRIIKTLSVQENIFILIFSLWRLKYFHILFYPHLKITPVDDRYWHLAKNHCYELLQYFALEISNVKYLHSLNEL